MLMLIAYDLQYKCYAIFLARSTKLFITGTFLRGGVQTSRLGLIHTILR